MARSITCASCGMTQASGSLHCIRCEQLLRPADSGPPLMAQPLPILDALPADEEVPLQATVVDDEPPKTDPPLSEEARKLTMSHRLTHLNAWQRAVYALLARTLAEYRSDRVTLVLGFLIVPVLLVLGVVLSALLMWGLTWLAAYVGRDTPLYLATVLIVLMARSIKPSVEAVTFAPELEGDRFDHYRLGRLRDIFHVGQPGSIALFFGACFGFQWGLLAGTSDHVGLDIEGGWWDCFLLTLDNVCHGIFLDIFELYDIHWGEKLQHGIWSATVFNIFRVTFDALMLLFLYVIYQRYRLRHLLWGLPEDFRSFDDVMGWLEYTCASREELPSRFIDEVLFLIVVKEYLAGQFELVRGMSEQLAWLKVEAAVRNLFRDGAGAVVFQGAYKPD